jgi:exodeoxyribonuclease-3
MRLLSYNIRYGGVGREDALARVIAAAEPDVVVLQEATHPHVVERLATALAMPHHGARERYSTGFLSRLPVAAHAWHRPRDSHHAFLELTLADGAPCIYGLHLVAWFSNWSERRRARELRALLDGVREHQHGFHAIAGDFNALAPGERLHVAKLPRWIQAMVWLSGNDIARHTIQLMLDERYVDAWRAHHPVGDGFTFPTWDPHVRLDYLFTPQPYADRVMTCEVMRELPGATEASDHYPLLIEFDSRLPTPDSR